MFTRLHSVALCKALELKGSRGDAAILAKTVGISFGFANRILHAFLDGSEDALMRRRKRATAFESTEWGAKFKEFVFQPENARPVPGMKKESRNMM